MASSMGTGENMEKNNNQSKEKEMKSFLEMKSTAQQLKEGVATPVDTAYIVDNNGQLMLKAVFDVSQFKPEEIDVKVEGMQLQLTAQCLVDEDGDEKVYRKTMNRKIDLPDNANPTAMTCDISSKGILTISMPFHLAQQRQEKPPGPSTVPIITENGRRKIRLQILIGRDFTMDDVKVESEGSSLTVTAFYAAEVGLKGSQVTQRELKKEFRLPDAIQVDEVSYALTKEGFLLVEILLKDHVGQSYRCLVTTQDVTGQLQQT